MFEEIQFECEEKCELYSTYSSDNNQSLSGIECGTQICPVCYHQEHTGNDSRIRDQYPLDEIEGDSAAKETRYQEATVGVTVYSDAMEKWYRRAF